MNPSGPSSRGVQKGAAYVYRRSATTGLWYEETKLFLDDGLGTDRYGWQVWWFTPSHKRVDIQTNKG